jgi:2-haloacid dehalogenase
MISPMRTIAPLLDIGACSLSLLCVERNTGMSKHLHANLSARELNISGFAFDVFGTVVDWRSTIIHEGQRLKRAVKWPAFADDWMNGYRARVEAVRTGQRPWSNLDALLAETFRELVRKFNLDGIDPVKLAHFGSVWHRLKPWPDVLTGLRRLRKRFRMGTLSNGNMVLLIDMAKHRRLAWDCELSAELVKRYKPEREAYDLAATSLGSRADEVIYVAAHKWDLEASKIVGLKTAFVPRPLEMGSDNPPPEDPSPDPAFDIFAKDFNDLADQFGE